MKTLHLRPARRTSGERLARLHRRRRKDLSPVVARWGGRLALDIGKEKL